MTNPVCRNVAVVIALHGSGEWIPNDAVAKSIVMTCLMLCGSAGSWPASDVSDEFSLCSPEYSDFSSTVSRASEPHEPLVGSEWVPLWGAVSVCMYV